MRRGLTLQDRMHQSPVIKENHLWMSMRQKICLGIMDMLKPIMHQILRDFNRGTSGLLGRLEEHREENGRKLMMILATLR